jgi:hypothetical protein
MKESAASLLLTVDCFQLHERKPGNKLSTLLLISNFQKKKFSKKILDRKQQ